MEELHLENERLISASKARSEFLTIMSHELRTPLTSVIGYSIILQGKTQGELNKKQMYFVDNILKSSKHLLDLFVQIPHILFFVEATRHYANQFHGNSLVGSGFDGPIGV